MDQPHPSRTWEGRTAAAVALVTTVLGGVALAGWYAQVPVLYQPQPEWAAVPVLAAFGLLVAGLVLLGLARGWRRAGWAGFPLVLVGIAALVEVQTGFGIGLDRLLISLSPEKAQLGHLDSGAALGLVLTGAALFLLSQPQRSRRQPVVPALLASLVVAVGGIVLLGQATVGRTIVHGTLTNLAVPLAVGFVTSGTGLLVLAWRDGRTPTGRAPRWLPLPVGLGIAAGALMLWQALHTADRSQLTQAVHQAAEAVSREINPRLAFQVAEMHSIARKWDARRAPGSRAEFVAALSPYYNPGLVALERVDGADRRLWISPADAGGLGAIPATVDEYRHAIETARDLLRHPQKGRRAGVSRTVPLPGGQGFFVAVPSGDGGATIFTFRPQEALDFILRDNLAAGYGVAVFDGGTEIYRRPGADGRYEADWSQELQLVQEGNAWQIRVWPTPAAMAREHSSLPDLALGAELVLGVLLAVAVYYSQSARQRLDEAVVANRRLEAEAAERRRAERARQASEDRARLVIDTAPDAFVVMDEEGNIVDWNRQAEAIFGWARAEVLGRPLADTLIPARHRDAHRRGLKQYLATGRHRILHTRVELDALHRDGREFPVELIVTPGKWGERAVFNAFLHDISQRREADQALWESEERYRRFFDEDLAGAAITRADGRFITCNPAFARIFGFSSVAEALQANAGNLYPDARTRDEVISLLKAERKLLLREMEFRRHDGRPVHTIANLIGTFDAAGELTEIKGYFWDNTERRDLEQQYRQSQKMEAVGQLAGGVAHDFNNLLTIIMGCADALLLEGGPTAPSADLLREIGAAADRAAALTRQLLAFSRKQVVNPVRLDLNALLHETNKMVRRLIGENRELESNLEPELWPVKADPGQLEQVVLNLVVNARDAMPRGGKLTVTTANVHIDPEYACHHPGVVPGPYVELAVTDTGCGMSAEVQARIFEPFFTTKEAGKGTGLGLATVYGIVTQAGGHVAVDSVLGRGTTFRVYLPRAAGTEPSTNGHAPRDDVGHGNETILLVEDEEAVRKMARRALEQKGYSVLTAADGPEALQLARTHPGPIHLLITDVVMPRMSGRETADRLVQDRPGLPVLYMSGYTDDAVLLEGVRAETVPFLHKPFAPATLTQRVRQLLDQRVPAADPAVSH